MLRQTMVIFGLLLLGCQGERGPMGPRGLPGESGGLEFHQFGGTVPTSGQTAVTVPYLQMDCPPLIAVYLETSPGNWIAANILDTYEDNGQTVYHLEYVVLDDGTITVSSFSAIAFSRPVPFIVTMVAPIGYFDVGYRCP